MSTYLYDYKLVKQMTKNIRKRVVTEIADSTKQRKCSVIFTQDDDVKYYLAKARQLMEQRVLSWIISHF